MRIVQEKFEREEYLELCLSEREFDLIKEYMIISKKCLLNGEITNIGVKLELELDDEENFEKDVIF